MRKATSQLVQRVVVALEEHVLKAVEHDYKKGKVTAIIGKGGLGKSTTLKLLVEKHYNEGKNSYAGVSIFMDEPGSCSCMNEPGYIHDQENKPIFNYNNLSLIHI